MELGEMTVTSPLLSVCIRTYNQERFVAKALDGVLMQKTSFPFEIIVSDDCSIDGTRDILLKYQRLFADKIRLILGEQNVGGPRNLRRVIEASTAKYITCLDGDDYYTDKYKLQKQIDFLEENERYAACFHNVVVLNEKTGTKSLFLPLNFPEEVNAKDVISKRWFLPIHSIVMRSKFIAFPEWYEEVMNDDYVVDLSVALHGPFYYMSDVMAVYRRHDANTSIQYANQLLINKQLYMILDGFAKIYPQEYRSVFEDKKEYYKREIDFWEKEMKHPIRKWFRPKTYKRLVKKRLRKFCK
jgi:glycosyltransferase involved in cell wall biosynthesis